ncbi:DUF6544 family protein [Rhodococcus sp. CH91]|uniref:DUF6544 family protein n=1 Tax=Rhodococcus sp. CH91 TaxID=2910256 RepID=UPI001F4B318C|nr:DUF6544 family protein [Rhodococcus sp. CH91]
MSHSSSVPRSARDIGEQWRVLTEIHGSGRFAPACLDEMPAAARRWLTHAVAANTPLARSARLTMSGQIRIGSWRPFTADQILVPATGFIWAATAKVGPLAISGYDALTSEGGRMRWRLGGIVPVMSARGREIGDSAAGRLAGESVFVPTAFPLARWSGEDDVATATWTVAGREDRVHLDLATDGTLRRVRMHRWGAPAGHDAARYPFTVNVEAERTFDGLTIASRIRAAWDTGDASDGEFFRAEITGAHFS